MFDPRFLVDIDIFFTSIVLHLPDTVAAGDNPFRRPVVLPLPRGRIDDQHAGIPMMRPTSPQPLSPPESVRAEPGLSSREAPR